MKNARPQTAETSAVDKRDSIIGIIVRPSFPTRGTQPARLLADLLRGRRVNPLDAWRRLGIYRLSDTVLQLRRLGWPVITDRLDVLNKFSEECHVALYSLPADAIEQAGDAGAKFIEQAERSAA